MKKKHFKNSYQRIPQKDVVVVVGGGGVVVVVGGVVVFWFKKHFQAKSTLLGVKIDPAETFLSEFFFEKVDVRSILTPDLVSATMWPKPIEIRLNTQKSVYIVKPCS